MAKRKMDFRLEIFNTSTGAYNFRLLAIPYGCGRGYFSPLASYISAGRARTYARYHAGVIAHQYRCAVGRLIEDASDAV